jgi:two-component system cell cycle response regulator DivK
VNVLRTMAKGMNANSWHAPKSTRRLLMVVDDDAHRREFHAKLLQRFEYRVCTASNVEDALDMIASEPPALIIAELDLPGMSGLDLLARIKQEPHTADIPVIALAANRDQGIGIRCLRAGFSAFLGTPVGLEELYRTIQTAIEPVTRASLRVRTQMPVIVDNVPLDGVKGECALVISEHGMYIRTLKPHPPNARLTVQISVKGRTIAADAVVLYSHRLNEGNIGEPGMGVKFERIVPRDQEFLRLFIHDEIAQQ